MSAINIIKTDAIDYSQCFLSVGCFGGQMTTRFLTVNLVFITGGFTKRRFTKLISNFQLHIQTAHVNMS